MAAEPSDHICPFTGARIAQVLVSDGPNLDRCVETQVFPGRELDYTDELSSSLESASDTERLGFRRWVADQIEAHRLPEVLTSQHLQEHNNHPRPALRVRAMRLLSWMAYQRQLQNTPKEPYDFGAKRIDADHAVHLITETADERQLIEVLEHLHRLGHVDFLGPDKRRKGPPGPYLRLTDLGMRTGLERIERYSDGRPPESTDTEGEAFVARLTELLRQGRRPLVKVSIGDGETVEVMSSAGTLITKLYAWYDEFQHTLMPEIERAALGEGAEAIGMVTLARLFPNDFDGVADLLVPINGETGFENIFQPIGGGRSSVEINRDHAVIAEHILRKHGVSQGSSRLVVGKDKSRRRWIGLGQELGVDPLGGGWAPGDPPDGEEIFEPFEMDEIAGPQPEAPSKQPTSVDAKPPAPGEVTQALTINRDAVVASAGLTLEAIDAYLEPSPGHNGGPALEDGGSAAELAVLRASIYGFRSTVLAWTPESETTPIEAAGEEVRSSFKRYASLAAQEFSKSYFGTLGSWAARGTVFAMCGLVAYLLHRAGIDVFSVPPEEAVKRIYIQEGVDI